MLFRSGQKKMTQDEMFAGIDKMNQHFAFIKPSETKAPSFSLYYTDVLGNLKEYGIPVNEEWMNNFILFPSGLYQGVRSCFMSETYRTSITGTFKFQV